MLLKQLFRDQFRLLTFQSFKPDLARYRTAYLLFGLSTALFAGFGRYWDNPRALWWQTLGLGSLAYCFVMAFIIFVVLYPLKPQRWSYTQVLIFVSFTSMPAFLYAIPVEKFMTLKNAQVANLYFLLVVATWRVLLFVRYLKRSAELSAIKILVSFLLPIILIISLLSVLNLEHVIIKLMAGLRDDEKSVNDLAYQIVIMLTFFSFFLLPVLIPAYLYFIFAKKRV